MNEYKNLPKVTKVLISLYVILFVLDNMVLKGLLFELCSGKNLSDMQVNEWYRLFTAPFFHRNFFHLLANIFAIYFVGHILENKIGSLYFALIYLMGHIGSSFVLAKLYYFNEGCGSSLGIYALIACIFVLHLRNRDFLNLRFGTWSLNYTICYFFIGNLIGISTLMAHSVGFIFGIITSILLLTTGILKL